MKEIAREYELKREDIDRTINRLKSEGYRIGDFGVDARIFRNGPKTEYIYCIEAPKDPNREFASMPEVGQIVIGSDNFTLIRVYTSKEEGRKLVGLLEGFD